PLDRSVITIGRRHDNTIVLDDSRISRQHAQLRYRQGAFVLYDLGSRGGTFVNGARITEVALRPGDVIALAGVTVVYVEDEVDDVDDADVDHAALRSGGDTAVGLNAFDPDAPPEDDTR
ncbi:MAG: FHA domain-containing protein, partial [Chloroflexi bacterium]|nr:FHA domain-containing protein [Chloroflexota bacterium]